MALLAAQKGSSGGGINIDFSAVDAYNSSSALASHATLSVTVTQKPRFVIVVADRTDSPYPTVYNYDVVNSKVSTIGRRKSDDVWQALDETSRMTEYFPTVSSSVVTFYNSAGVAKVVFVACYY